MTETSYENFDVVLTGAGGSYEARVLGSPAGEGSTSFVFPFEQTLVENFVLKIGQPRRVRRRLGSPATVELMKSFGGDLFDAVFSGDTGRLLAASRDSTRSRSVGLRVRLRLQDVPELADVPWECLYDRRTNSFLCLSSLTPVIRYLELPTSTPPLQVEQPVRILVVISDPSDVVALDVDAEWRIINQALEDLVAQGRVQVDRLPAATLSELKRWLRTNEAHVLHFVGHGAFDADYGAGVLAFENDEGTAEILSGEDLGVLLHDHLPLRLVVLNACEGARSDLADPFCGTAQRIVQQGIPAVVAMQFEVTDQAAIALAHEFYGAISDGYGVESALGEARKAVRASVSESEWMTPVLYLRASDGRLFDVQPAHGRPPSTQRPPVVPQPVSEPVIEPAAELERWTSAGLGIKRVADVVRMTVGPGGRAVALPGAEGSAGLSTDTEEIVNRLPVRDESHQVGVELLRKGIGHQRQRFGDGLATTVVLVAAMLEEGFRSIAAGANPVMLQREIDKAVAAVNAYLEPTALEVDSKEMIHGVLTLAYPNDPDIAEMVSEAVDKVGKDAPIVVDNSNTYGLDLDFTEGLRLDQGFISPSFVTDVERGEAVLEDPYVLMVAGKLSDIGDFVPLLEKVIEKNQPLLVLADDVDGQMLATLVVNKTREAFQSAAVKVPGFGDRRRAILGDIAAIVGGQIIAEEVGLMVKDATLEMLGRVGRVVITKDDTTLIDGRGSQSAIGARIKQLQTDIEETDSDWDRERMQERLAGLAAGVALIRVGGDTETQVSARKREVERAIRTVRAAIGEGVVPGSGLALFKALEALPESPDESGGVGIVRFALQAPLEQILLNAGFDPGAVMAELAQAGAFWTGFDVKQGELCNFADKNLCDPLSTIKSALDIAAQIASACLTLVE